MRSALVLTISDGVSGGTREDASGAAVADRLSQLSFEVTRQVVADDMEAIGRAITDASERCDLVVSTGGTGMGPRDVTPQTLNGLLDYEIPGFGEQMRAYGRTKTPMADISRSMGGVLGSTLVIAMPGSPAGAMDSLTAIEGVLDHALETLGGHTQHARAGADKDQAR